MEQQRNLNKNKLKIAGAWTVSGLIAAALFIYSGMSFYSAAAVDQSVAGVIVSFLKTLFSETVSPDLEKGLIAVSGLALWFCGYALLTLCLWLAFRCMRFDGRSTILWSFAFSVVFAALNVFHRQFASGRLLLSEEILADCLGILFTLLCIALCRWMWVKFPRVFNRETISYVIFGVLTTIVNIVVNGVFVNTLHKNYLISNMIAWVAAVLFAYVVNKIFVFHSHNDTVMQTLREFGLFIGARVLSFAVDEPGMIIFYGLLHINNGVAKILVNIIVMIMNYFFSKWIIFKKPTSDADGAKK